MKSKFSFNKIIKYLLFCCIFLYMGCEKSMEPTQELNANKPENSFKVQNLSKIDDASIMQAVNGIEGISEKDKNQLFDILKSNIESRNKGDIKFEESAVKSASSDSWIFSAVENSNDFNCYARVYPVSFIAFRFWYMRDKTDDVFAYIGYTYNEDISFGWAWPITGHRYEVISEEYLSD